MKLMLALLATLTLAATVVQAEDENRKAAEDRQRQLQEEAARRARDNAAKQQADEARKQKEQQDAINRPAAGK